MKLRRSCSVGFLSAVVLPAVACSAGTGAAPVGGGAQAAVSMAGQGSAGLGNAGGSDGMGLAGAGGAPPAGGGVGAGGDTPVGAAGTAGAAGMGGGGGVPGAGGADPGGFVVPTVTWPSAACQQQAAELLAQMTPEEKAAQMVMADNPPAGDVTTLAPGAVFAPGGAVPPGGSTAAAWAAMTDSYHEAAAASRLGIPIFYGADAVHGHNLATDAVIFPHNAGLGCTRNPALVQEIGRVTAMETAATGINWTFAPVVSVSHDDRWGRVYESFSEDVAITAELSAAIVLGLQGGQGLGTGQPGIVACAKHWAGDGQATAGTSHKAEGIVDRGDIQIDEALMRELGIAPYLPAIQGGLGSVMVSDATWNGMSLTASGRMMNEILKEELGFSGFVTTDWNAAVEGPAPGVGAAINAGVDMLMQPADWRGAITSVMNEADAARIDDAVTRLLVVKCEAGLFDAVRDQTLLGSVGSAEHRMVARQAVKESLVLLQNDNNALPLTKGSNIWLGGSGADSMANQCGGWTIAWQGDGSAITGGTTISAAIGAVATVTGDLATADAAVVVLSEQPYAEFRGDRESINTLPDADFTALSQARASGVPVVAIVMSGRPVLIADALLDADAWIAAWLPGSEGAGVADVLFGDYAPTGKLSHSWPRTQDQVNVNFGDAGYDPLFPLGHGLTY